MYKGDGGRGQRRQKWEIDSHTTGVYLLPLDADHFHVASVRISDRCDCRNRKPFGASACSPRSSSHLQSRTAAGQPYSSIIYNREISTRYDLEAVTIDRKCLGPLASTGVGCRKPELPIREYTIDVPGLLTLTLISHCGQGVSESQRVLRFALHGSEPFTTYAHRRKHKSPANRDTRQFLLFDHRQAPTPVPCSANVYSLCHLGQWTLL